MTLSRSNGQSILLRIGRWKQQPAFQLFLPEILCSLCFLKVVYYNCK